LFGAERCFRKKRTKAARRVAVLIVVKAFGVVYYWYRNIQAAAGIFFSFD